MQRKPRFVFDESESNFTFTAELFHLFKMAVQSLVSKKKKSFIGLPAPLGYVPGLGRGLVNVIYMELFYIHVLQRLQACQQIYLVFFVRVNVFFVSFFFPQITFVYILHSF